MDRDFPFWRFSLALYGKPDVPATCIDLQDAHGIDVNILFYLLFRAHDGVALGPDEIARLDAAIAPWRDEVVRPLRRVRRALKQEEFTDVARDDDALRNRVKSAELHSEKLQQHTLQRIGASFGGAPCEDPSDAVRKAWQAYATYLDTALPDTALDAILSAQPAAEIWSQS